MRISRIRCLLVGLKRPSIVELSDLRISWMRDVRNR